MKLNSILLIIKLVMAWQVGNGQSTDKHVFEVTIYKIEDVQGTKIRRYIVIDSSGSIYRNNRKLKNSFDVDMFSREITNYVVAEKVHKFPGNDDISFLEHRAPGLDEQVITISIKFAEDVIKEKNLRNKTYYSWGNNFKSGNIEYPLFKFLSPGEVDILKLLLE